MSLCPTLRFSICDIYNMFCAVVIQYFAIVIMLYNYVLISKKYMLYTGKLNFVLLLPNFVVNISTTCSDKVVSMLFFQRRNNADEHTLTQF